MEAWTFAVHNRQSVLDRTRKCNFPKHTRQTVASRDPFQSRGLQNLSWLRSGGWYTVEIETTKTAKKNAITIAYAIAVNRFRNLKNVRNSRRTKFFGAKMMNTNFAAEYGWPVKKVARKSIWMKLVLLSPETPLEIAAIAVRGITLFLWPQIKMFDQIRKPRSDRRCLCLLSVLRFLNVSFTWFQKRTF